MITNILLLILLVLAIIGLINSVEIEMIPKNKKDNDYASRKLREKLSKAGANEVTQVNDTMISFKCDDVPYYLDWRHEPLTSLYTLFKLNDSVDLEKAKQLAKDLSYEYDTISIRINDDREMAIGCSTIIPDATSLMAVTPYMLEVVGKALEVFLTSYERAISGQDSN